MTNMKKYYPLILLGLAIIAIALFVQNQQANIGGIGGTSGSGSVNPFNFTFVLPTTPPATSQPSYAPSNERVPTSLLVTVEPNPVVMRNRVIGEIVSDGRNYPATVHIKHVGSGQEQSFGVLLDDYGQFYHSQTIDVAGYYDVWATCGSVTSNKPRLCVQGAMVTMEDEFFSRMIGDYTTTVQVYSHSSGNCQIYIDTGYSSTLVASVHINSGGYASAIVDFSEYGLSLGTYTLNMVVNGIRASDYSATASFTIGR